jgi:hypothetical protein
MFSYIKRVTGNITVRENDGIITIEGVPGYVIKKDIKNIWGTDKVNANMFLDIDNSSFSFLSFYATDVLFTLEQLTNSNRSLKVSLRTLSKIKEKLIEHTWLARTLEEAPKILDRSKLKELVFTPLDYQAAFFDVYEENTFKYGLNGMLLAASVGSGKSFTSLALTTMLDVDIVIVVCPKSALIKVWQESIKTLFHKPYHYWLSLQEEKPRGNERFYIVHYEALSKMLEIAKDFKNKKVAVILDESHNLNETTSLRANYFVDLCNLVNSKHTIWLSGTPFKAIAIESVPLLRSIDPLFTKEVEIGFRKIFGKSNTRAVEILNNRLGLISFKVEKSQLKLKEPIFSEIKVKTTNAQEYTLNNIKKIMREFINERQDYYKDRQKQDEAYFYECLDIYSNTIVSKQAILDYKEYVSCLKIVITSGGDYSAKAEIVFCNRYELSKIIPNLPNDRKAIFRDIRSIVKYVNLKIQGEALGRVFGKMRAQCHVDMIEHIDFNAICQSTTMKTVVFTSFVQVVEKAQTYLKQEGLNPLVVYGKTNVNLASIVSSFETDDDLNPLIATYKSLSTAVPLIMANVMVIIDSPFREYQLSQAIGRIHRLGSDTQTYIYTCSLDTGSEMNISTRSFEILAICQKTVEEITGTKSPYTLTDNPEEFAYALEGLDINVLEPIGNLKPSFLSW